ncbi:MAG: M20/M25/M40 family metallo-hydrolase [Acidobacteriota bacterium]
MFRRYATVALLVVSFLLPGAALQAQSVAPQEKVDLEAITKIKDEGTKNSKVMEFLSYMTDVHGPRLTGSPQLRGAQEWAKKKFTELGLQNARLESWGPFGRGWSLENFQISMLKPTFSPVIAYPKAWSGSTKGTVRGEVVYLNIKNDADFEKYKGKLKGAIVLLGSAREVKAHFEPEGARMTDKDLLEMANAQPAGGGRGGNQAFQLSPEQQARFERMRAEQALNNKKLLFCVQEGAAVVLEPGRGDGGNLFVQSATLPYPQDTPPNQRKNVRDKDAPEVIPQIVVSVEHYNRMARAIEKGTPVQMEVNVAAKYYDQDLNDYNVIAEIPGTDLKDEIVMLGGHYDSWHGGTGATDNAAGCAVAMEAVRIILASGLKPRRTIRVALWSGEEQGLLGSRAYVAQHFGRRTDAGANQFGGPPGAGGGQAQPSTPTFEIKPEHDKFAGYFNLDNGTGKIRGVYMQGNEGVRTIFRAWLAPFKDMGASTLTISNTGGTDHLAYDAVGLPGFQFIQDTVEYDTRTHHSTQDVYDRIQEDDMKQAAIIMAAFVYNTAMRDQKLPRKPLPGQVVNAKAAGN